MRSPPERMGKEAAHPWKQNAAGIPERRSAGTMLNGPSMKGSKRFGRIRETFEKYLRKYLRSIRDASEK